GIAGFAFLQAQVEKQVREQLQQLSVDRAAVFAQFIEQYRERARLLISAHAFQMPTVIASTAAAAPAARDALQRWAATLPEERGFSSISLRQGDSVTVRAGESGLPTTSVALAGGKPAWLLWRDGFVLRQSLPLPAQPESDRTLILEQRLDTLTRIHAQANRVGLTGEMAICAALAEQMNCFPLRNRPRPYRVARVIDGIPLPMDFALRGRTGSIISLDYRRHRVLAAYAPIGNTGLGLVVKRDVSEIYAPIRVQFQRIVLFLAALLALGMLVLRRRLRPLLHTLEATRAQARENAVRFGAAVESNLDAFFILECVRDADGTASDLRYTLLNGKAERLLGQARERVVGKRLFDPFPDQRDAQMLADFLRVIETGEPLIEERCGISTIGESRWYHLQLVRLGDGLGVTVRDITRARAAAERLRHQALHDELTGLPNRAAFEQAVATAIIEARKHGGTLALALLDLDGFKQVNDTLGHAAGDLLLQQVAVRLRDCLRPSDIVARLGGDEFVLVLPAINWPAGAIAVANKLIAQIALPIVIDQDTVSVTASIGLSVFPDDGRVAATLLHSADQAMYRAKRAGRNGYALHQDDLHQDDPQRAG
ncbi:MAG: diguanylate cyclase, partial [Lysobacteraceae bacterium]